MFLFPRTRWKPRVFLLLFAGVCAAAAQHSAQSPPSAAQSWRISGRVVDARSGQALARCAVAIAPTTTRNRSISIETGDNGQFIFEGLASGKYALSASRRGYLTQSYQEHETYFTGIAVGLGLQSEGLLFQLTPQAVLFGTVVDEAGEPVRRAQVKLFADRDREGVRSTQLANAVSVDDRGMYEISNVSPGNYFLAVSAQPWYARGRASGVFGHDSDTSTVLDVAYPTTFYINATDSDEATPIPVKGGERIEASFTLVAQHAMPLRIAVPRNEQSQYSVSVTQSVFGQSEPLSTGEQTNHDGLMEVDGVLPGHYEVTLTSFTANRQQSTRLTAEVTSDATQVNQEASAEEISVTGKVISLDAKVPSGSIALASTHPRRRYDGPISEAGDFSIRVPAGTYEVLGFIPQMYLASVTSPNAALRGRMLEVKAGDSPTLQIVTGNGWGEVEGVAESGGHGASGIMVVLAPEDAKNNAVLFRRDQSDSDGTFSLSGIVPGHYRLLAIQDGWDLAWADPNVLAAFLKKSVSLDIRAHAKLTQVIEVQSR